MVNVLMHVAVWIVALSLPYMLDTHHGIHDNGDACVRRFRYLNFVTSLIWTVPFYLNAYVLTPRLFLHRRYALYTGMLLLVFAILILIHYYLFVYTFSLGNFNIRGATNFLLPPFLLVTAVSTTFRIVVDKIRADEKVQEQQKENLKTELSFLRSQINPHFIFNILNNLVALDQMKSPELGPTILKLASLMRYMLYETDEDRVSLAKEVEYLQSFIDLQQQRFGKKVAINIKIDMPDNFYEIEPMLLIPFVENAFKHGVGLIENPTITIHLYIQKATLHFEVRNRFNAQSSETQDRTSGIGLNNVKRRLKLLYDDKQSLEISKQDDWFVVLLKINLQ